MEIKNGVIQDDTAHEALAVLTADPAPLSPDVEAAVEYSAEARCGRLSRGILRIGKRLRKVRAKMNGQTDALMAAIQAINDAGILMPDEVLEYTSATSVRVPRLTDEQMEVQLLLSHATAGKEDFETVKVTAGVLRAAFPELGEVDRGL